jgi:hypothetical protein
MIDQGAAIEKQLGIYCPPNSPRNDSLSGAVPAASEFIVETRSNARLVVTGTPRRLPDWLGGSPRGAPTCKRVSDMPMSLTSREGRIKHRRFQMLQR